ncbi:MAG: hypothetical protein K2N05_08370 [Muribaculaceae bacterium]|nr:hypothetical protein [Muribaculaceae bacterium]
MLYRKQIYILLIWILISIIYLSCGRDSSDKVYGIKKTIEVFAKNDTSKFAKQLIARLDSVSLDKEEERKRVYAIASEYSYHLFSTGCHTDAIRFLEEESKVMNSGSGIANEDLKHLFTIYVGLGAAYDETGMPGIGLDYYSKGLTLSSDTVFDKYRAMLYNNIGVLYNRSSRNDMAEQYFRKALQINLKTKLKKEIFLNYNNLATVFDEENELKKALDASLSGLQYITAEENPEDFYSTQISLGSLYSRIGEMEMARSYLKNGMERLESINFVPGRVDAYKQLAEYYLSVGRLDSAQMYGMKSWKLANSSSLIPLEISSLKILADISSKEGKYKLASEYLSIGDKLKDSLRNEENRLRLKEWEKVRHDELEREQESVSNVGEGWKLTTWIFACLFFVLSAALVYVMVSNRKNDKMRDEELDRLNREMTSLSIDRLKLHEGVESVSEDLSSLFSEMMMKNISQKTKSREIVAKLNHISDNTIDEFRQYFDKVHPDFTKLLETRYPELTPRDIRLCSFLLLGLSTKEIASITYREVRSVESARNRLRKKLGLDANANIIDFLKSLK